MNLPSTSRAIASVSIPEPLRSPAASSARYTRVGSRSIDSHPAFASFARYSSSSSAPATQPIQISTFLLISAGATPPTTTSDAAAGAKVEHDLAWAQLGQRRRVATAARGRHRLGRQRGGLLDRVEVRRDRIALAARRAAAAGAARARHAQRHQTVLLPHDLLD